MDILNLRKSFGEILVINDLSLDLPEGKLLSVLGPSGSGKTTLLRCIAGVETPDGGVIKIGSRTVFDSKEGINVPPERRGIGMVFQSNTLWPHMTVKKNIAYPLEIRKATDAEAKVRDVLELMKIGALAQRYPNEISGGEAQRVAIARAIVYEPALILLDEPFSSLDVLLRESLRDELRQLQVKLGTTMIYVTHDRVDALSLADVMVVLSNGRIEAKGSANDLLKSPPNSYTARLLGGMLVVDGNASTPEGGIVRVQTRYGMFLVPSGLPAGSAKLCIPPSSCWLLDAETSGAIPGTLTGWVVHPSGSKRARVSTVAGTIEVGTIKTAVHMDAGSRVYLGFESGECFLVDH